MTRPVYSPTTEDVYAGMGPLVPASEEPGWLHLHFIAAFGEMLDFTESFVRDRGDVPGIAILLDLDTCPDWALPWLAQFVGVVVPPSATPSEVEFAIEAHSGWFRGGYEQFTAAARLHLTGTKHVGLIERAGGDAYSVLVRTLASETPDPAATLADLLAAKPVGLVLDYATTTGSTYDDIRTEVYSISGSDNYNARDAVFNRYQDEI